MIWNSIDVSPIKYLNVMMIKKMLLTVRSGMCCCFDLDFGFLFLLCMYVCVRGRKRKSFVSRRRVSWWWWRWWVGAAQARTRCLATAKDSLPGRLFPGQSQEHLWHLLAIVLAPKSDTPLCDLLPLPLLVSKSQIDKIINWVNFLFLFIVLINVRHVEKNHIQPWFFLSVYLCLLIPRPKTK